MITIWWSVLLTTVGITGLWIVSNHRWQGWLISLASEILWIAYAVVTQQWGFIAAAVVYSCVHARALYRWRRQPELLEIH